MTALPQAMVTMIKENPVRVFLVVFFLLFMVESNAQNTDLRARIGADASFELSPEIGVNVSVEQRFENNLSLLDKSLIEPEINYNIGKKIRLGLAWRTSFDQSGKNTNSIKHRATGYFRYRFLIDDFDFRIKTSLQYGVDDLTTSVYSTDNNLVNRNSLTIRYKWFGKPITPELGCEMYYHLNHPRGAIVNQLRLKAGLAYKINKKSEVSLYYLFDNEFNIAYPTDSHVLGLSYSFEI